MCFHSASATLSPNHWWASSWTTTESPLSGVLKKYLRVDGPGLGLQGEVQLVVVVDDPAAGRERVATELLLEEVEDLALAREGALGDPAVVGDAPSSGSTGSVKRSGSMASYIHSPSEVRYLRVSNSPTFTVVRYEAIGSAACQTQVRLLPWRSFPSRRPLATTSRPAGAVTTKV